MISRARPLLGTLVSIRADAALAAVDAAFAAIARVHELMSSHSDTSDLARISAEGHARPVRVHPWTFRVLSCAQALSRASDGAFDVTLRRGGASHDDVLLLPGNRVRLRRSAKLDLGGIAKGFAVDRAVGVLKRYGAASATVNAGGDLRFFGRTDQTVRVRLPARPQMTIPVASQCVGAFATSAGYFGEGPIHVASGLRACKDMSVTVAALSCMIADGLTKIVSGTGPSGRVLASFRARALLLDGNGVLYATRA